MPSLACLVDARFPLHHDHPPLPAPDPSFPSPAAAAVSPPWSTDHSASLYKIPSWGAPYFAVNPSGNISVRPAGPSTLPHQEIDLLKVVQKASSDPKHSGGLGLRLPLIVRFPDVLRHRLEELNSAFQCAIQSNEYNSHYQGVYPVKCNQDRSVVQDVVEFGSCYRFGLEAGSKPELLLAMSCLINGNPDAFLVCNGYKDEEYISLALFGKRLNLNTVIVLEQEEEADIVIAVSKKLGVRPTIGLRAKLRTKHLGHFGSTSGEKGKFGLTAMQMLSVARKLEACDMLDCLQLLHFHIGSQIPNTALLSDGVGEATQIYCELVRHGASMRVIDIGGGLGIDYDGSQSGGSDMSVSYSLDEYAAAVVQTVRIVCDKRGVAHPIISSESGRALVSHQSVLVFEAISSNTTIEATSIDPNLAYFLESLVDEAGNDYRNLVAAALRTDFDSCLVLADQLKRNSVNLFKEGVINLEHLAAVDTLCDLVSEEIGSSNTVHTYNINLSIFTSIPDYWAIGQLFPIVPIHRLDEKPAVNGVLSDLTCDSDGKIDKFIGEMPSIPLHECGAGGGYYLGMFLGGAYQEALGGMHNLFGGPSVVRVQQSDGPYSFAVTRAISGPSCADVLSAMQHEPEIMFEALKRRAEEYVGGNAPMLYGLARAFHGMPYLVCGGCEEEEEEDVVGGGEEEESWEFMRCLSV